MRDKILGPPVLTMHIIFVNAILKHGTYRLSRDVLFKNFLFAVLYNVLGCIFIPTVRIHSFRPKYDRHVPWNLRTVAVEQLGIVLSKNLKTPR